MGKHQGSKRWKGPQLRISNIFNDVVFFEAERNGATILFVLPRIIVAFILLHLQKMRVETTASYRTVTIICETLADHFKSPTLTRSFPGEI